MAWKKHYQETTADEDAGVSGWHSSSLIARRMHEFYMAFARLWRNGLFPECNDVLDLVWGEMIADAKKEERERIREFDAHLAEINCNLQKSRGKNLKCRAEFAICVKEKFYYLKVLEKNQGLGKMYRDEFEDDFD